MMAFAVGKERHDELSGILLRFVRFPAFMTQAHVASLAVLAVGLAKVTEQLTAATNAVVRCIFNHRVYA